MKNIFEFKNDKKVLKFKYQKIDAILYELLNDIKILFPEEFADMTIQYCNMYDISLTDLRDCLEGLGYKSLEEYYLKELEKLKNKNYI